MIVVQMVQTSGHPSMNILLHFYCHAQVRFNLKKKKKETSDTDLHDDEKWSKKQQCGPFDAGEDGIDIKAIS